MALSFQEDLQQLLNRHSAEAPSGTPDYILAEMLTEILKTFNEAVGQRAEWRGESVELPALQRQESPDIQKDLEVQSGNGVESMYEFISEKIEEAIDGGPSVVHLTINVNDPSEKLF